MYWNFYSTSLVLPTTKSTLATNHNLTIHSHSALFYIHCSKTLKEDGEGLWFSSLGYAVTQRNTLDLSGGKNHNGYLY